MEVYRCCSCLLPGLARRSVLSFPRISWWAGIHCRTTVHCCGRSCRSFSSWWISWPGALETRKQRAAPESVRMTVLRGFIPAMQAIAFWSAELSEHSLPVAPEWLTVCPTRVPTNTPLPPFPTASSTEPSVHMCPISLRQCTCVQSACVSAHVSNQPAGIFPQASPESGPSVVLVSVVQQGADQVPPRRWWFWDLPGSSLYYRVDFSHWWQSSETIEKSLDCTFQCQCYCSLLFNGLLRQMM